MTFARLLHLYCYSIELEKKVSDLEHQATQRSAVAHQEKAEVDLGQVCSYSLLFL